MIHDFGQEIHDFLKNFDPLKINVNVNLFGNVYLTH